MHTKKFNHKIYKLDGNWVTKKLAQTKAAELREKGYNARVTSNLYGNFVWKRKK